MQYPNNLKKENHKIINYKNRGMQLEALLNDTNEYYFEKNMALIFKKPTPIGISKASYNKHGRVINEGYFLAPSTLDYNGLYKGKYIEFEAKESKNTTSFPLANIHPHQINHIRKVIEHHGIVFLIMKMNDTIFLLKGIDFIDFIDNHERKSIPYSFLIEKGYIIKEKIRPAIDYLPLVDEIYLKGESLWQKN